MIIIAISDQHGLLDFPCPKADLLIHAGDICPDFRMPRGPAYSWTQESWLANKWAPWLGGQRTVATLGNHDFASRYGVPKMIHIDKLVEVDGIKIWLSPWSNEFCGWAWMMDPLVLKARYDLIPDGTDIIVSHQPPYGYGDVSIFPQPDGDMHCGSKELLAAIERVKPKAVVNGHIHGGHGRYRHGTTDIYNVALLNDEYRRVHQATEIIL